MDIFLVIFRCWKLQEIENLNSARGLVHEDLKQIQAIADQSGAQVVLVMVPSSVQVCSSDELTYYPRHIDLNDLTRFDIDQPQRIMSEIAGSLNIPLYDLRDILVSSAQCLYQPRNMHWTVDGHRVVSTYLVDSLNKAGYIP